MTDEPWVSFAGQDVQLVSLEITIKNGLYKRPWSDPNATPIEDIEAAIRQVRETSGCRPNTIWMPLRTWIKIMRRTMTKRRFRRWRGRQKAARRRNNPDCAQPEYCRQWCSAQYYRQQRCRDCLSERKLMEAWEQ